MEVPQPKKLEELNLKDKVAVLVVGICKPSIADQKEIMDLTRQMNGLSCPFALDGPEDASKAETYDWAYKKYHALEGGTSWFVVDPEGKIIASGTDSAVKAADIIAEREKKKQAGEQKPATQPADKKGLSDKS